MSDRNGLPHDLGAPAYNATSGGITPPAAPSLGPSYGGDDEHASDEDDMSEAEIRRHSPGRGLSDQWDPESSKSAIRDLLMSGKYDSPARGADTFVVGLNAHASRAAANHASVPPLSVFKDAGPALSYASAPSSAPGDSKDMQPGSLPSGSSQTVTADMADSVPGHLVYCKEAPNAKIQHMDLASASGHQPQGLTHAVSADAQARASLSSFTPRMNRI
jgi:hypothetical protein